MYIIICILTVFFASRILFWFSGVKYDASFLDIAMQYLDVSILKEDLLEGIFYLHSQPPVFNIFLGSILKISPFDPQHVFHVVFLICGLITYSLLYRIFRLNQLRIWTAFSLSTIFILSPSAILYENYLFYTWPVSTLLVVSAYALLKYEATLRCRYVVLFIFTVTMLCFTRSAFHLIYLIGCILLIINMYPKRSKCIGRVFLVAIALVCMLYVKNFALFGFFGPSSWMGMHIWKIAGHSITNEEVSELIADGKIPEVASIKSFSALSDYPKYDKVPVAYSNIQTLSEELKNDGQKIYLNDLGYVNIPNYNHYGYISISKEYQQASFYIISHYFYGYLKSVIRAWGLYSRPSWDYYFLARNRQAIMNYIESISFARLRFQIERDLLGINARKVLKVKSSPRFPLSSLLVVPLAFILVGTGMFLSILKKIQGSGSQQIVFIFMTMTIFYVAIIGNCIEFGENHRFRAMTNPFLYITVVLTIRNIWITASNRFQNRRITEGSF